MSISQTVEEIVFEQPAMVWAMASGVVNYTAAAEYLKQTVEKRINRKVSTESVMMALRRMDMLRAKDLTGELGKIVAGSSYTIESGFSDVVIDHRFSDIKTIIKWLDEYGGESTTSLIVGLKYVSVVSDSAVLLEKMKSSNMNVIALVPELAIFKIKLPKEALNTPGVIAIFSQELAKRGVSVQEQESAHTEIGFIIKEQDINKAVEAFNHLKKSLGKK
ncbi:MAG: hypothetical protein V1492_02450 [Candidatus Micrarchaeota archaeon]